MNLAFQATGAAAVDAFCPRIAPRFVFAPGALTIAGTLAVLLIGVFAPVGAQLFIATFGALLGIWTVRQRNSMVAQSSLLPPAVEDSLPGQRKSFPCDTRRLSALGDAMLYKARKERQALSLAVFDFSDLPELQLVFEGRIADSFGLLIARRLQLIAPSKAVVVRTGPTTFAVLLPGFDGNRTRLAILRALGRACCIEFDAGNSEILLVPEFATQTVRSDAESIDEVYQQLRNGLTQDLRHSERRHAYLKLERESHTRPMRLAPVPPTAATMPASLAHAA